jgi:hypothetical protein
MNPEKFKGLLKQIETIANFEPDQRYKEIQGSSDRKQTLHDLEKEWGDKFSTDSINKRLSTLIKIAASEGSEALMNSLKTEDEYHKKFKDNQSVYVPVDGIETINLDHLELGNIRLELIQGDKLEHILQRMHSITRLTTHTDKEKELIMQQDREEITSIFGGKVCSNYEVIAEPDRAIEIAVLETSRSLELLRYSIWAVHPNGEKRIDIGLMSGTLKGRQNALALSETQLLSRWRRMTLPLRIEPSTIHKLRNAGVFKLSNIMKKAHKTDLELRLLRFLHWISDSYVQTEIENQLVSLLVGLEAVFGPGNNSVGFGSAIMIGKGLSDRKEIKEKVSVLYKHRNGVVHGSKNNSVVVEDVHYLRNMTMKLMIDILELIDAQKIKSIKDLKELIEERQLS